MRQASNISALVRDRGILPLCARRTAAGASFYQGDRPAATVTAAADAGPGKGDDRAARVTMQQSPPPSLPANGGAASGRVFGGK